VTALVLLNLVERLRNCLASTNLDGLQRSACSKRLKLEENAKHGYAKMNEKIKVVREITAVKIGKNLYPLFRKTYSLRIFGSYFECQNVGNHMSMQSVKCRALKFLSDGTNYVTMGHGTVEIDNVSQGTLFFYRRSSTL